MPAIRRWCAIPAIAKRPGINSTRLSIAHSAWRDTKAQAGLNAISRRGCWITRASRPSQAVSTSCVVMPRVAFLLILAPIRQELVPSEPRAWGVRLMLTLRRSSSLRVRDDQACVFPSRRAFRSAKPFRHASARPEFDLAQPFCFPEHAQDRPLSAQDVMRSELQFDADGAWRRRDRRSESGSRCFRSRACAAGFRGRRVGPARLDAAKSRTHRHTLLRVLTRFRM